MFPDGAADAHRRGPRAARLEARSRALGLGGAVALPGASADPSDRLRGADLFVLPSREEGMSVALLEAMALGVPLVATSIAGNRRLVQDFKHGRLVPPDDPAPWPARSSTSGPTSTAPST